MTYCPQCKMNSTVVKEVESFGKTLYLLACRHFVGKVDNPIGDERKSYRYIFSIPDAVVEQPVEEYRKTYKKFFESKIQEIRTSLNEAAAKAAPLLEQEPEQAEKEKLHEEPKPNSGARQIEELEPFELTSELDGPRVLKFPSGGSIEFDSTEEEANYWNNENQLEFNFIGTDLALEPVYDEIDLALNAIISKNMKTLMPFQKEGIRACLKAFRDGERGFLFGDDMGLGKTVQVLCFIKLVKILYDIDLSPILFVVKSKLKAQWLFESINWLGREYIPQLITTSKDVIIPGFPIYIVSLDMLRRFTSEEEVEVLLDSGSRKTKTIVKSIFRDKPFELVVIDECQLIKNPNSKRSEEVTAIGEKARFVIGASGTPIKNHAGEFYPILHLIMPKEFKDLDSFYKRHVEMQWNGRSYTFGGLKHPDLFHDLISKCFIRRTKEEVLPDLPLIYRQFHHVDFDNEKLKKQYKKEHADFIDWYLNEASSKDFYSQGLAYLSRMRHLTGVSKINACVEYALDFLESTDRKLIIFTHHIDVAQVVFDQLSELCQMAGYAKPLQYTGGLDGVKSNEIVEKFRNESRILVASTLAGGTGLNLQFCSDMVMLERQWNPADEEQAEDRISRIGQLAKQLTCVYMIATDTVDEYFTEIVERKRAVVAQTLDNKELEWNEQSLMAELMEALAGKRKRTA